MSPRWEPNPDIHRGRTVNYALHAHVVFTPKYRRRVFDDAMLTRCEEIMRKVCEDFGTELREFNDETDHLHLLVHYPPKVSLSRLAGSLKAGSARPLRQQFTSRVNQATMHGHFWSPSYFAASCGGATPLDHQGIHREPKAPGPKRHSDAAALRAAP